MATPSAPVPVVCAVIERAGRVLLAQRPPSKLLPLKWEFAGGKVEPGEDPAAAIIREIREELGCEIYAQLGQIKEAIHEPMGLWLPKRLRRRGTSVYAQGVEVPADFAGAVPAGCEIIDLPPCTMMVFQGPPFDEKHFEEAIFSLWDVMKTYRPELYGYEWADNDAPRFQLEPVGYRGYMEGRPVRPVNKAKAKSPRKKTAATPHPSRKNALAKNRTLQR